MMNTAKKYWWIGVLALVALALILVGRGGGSSRAWLQAVSLWHTTRRDRAEAELSKLDHDDAELVEKIEAVQAKAIDHEAKAREALDQADLPAEKLRKKIDDLYR